MSKFRTFSGWEWAVQDSDVDDDGIPDALEAQSGGGPGAERPGGGWGIGFGGFGRGRGGADLPLGLAAGPGDAPVMAPPAVGVVELPADLPLTEPDGSVVELDRAALPDIDLDDDGLPDDLERELAGNGPDFDFDFWGGSARDEGTGLLVAAPGDLPVSEPPAVGVVELPADVPVTEPDGSVMELDRAVLPDNDLDDDGLPDDLEAQLAGQGPVYDFDIWSGAGTDDGDALALGFTDDVNLLIG